jgi:predicted nucleotide-binding protein
MIERTDDSGLPLSSKRYILNEERAAVAENIRAQIIDAKRILREFEAIFYVRGYSEKEVTDFAREFDSWDKFNMELLRLKFTIAEFVNEYMGTPGIPPAFTGKSGRVQYIKRAFEDKIAILKSIRGRLPLYEKASKSGTSKQVERKTLGNEVFIIHGHDEGVKQTVARFVEHLGLEPVILDEKAGRSRAIIEKLEQKSATGYAVALITPDDEGKLRGEVGALKPRARQNVILELGYFIGKLGRQRICALKVEGVETPSDYHGVEYIPFDESGGWKLKLANELEAADYTIDRSKLK